MEDGVFFIWLTVGVFFLTAIIQLLFPVRVYEKAKESNLSTSEKGKFAYTVQSLYEIRTNGFDADGKYWWHITWFNTVVSLSVSAVVLFWTVIIMVILAIIVAGLVLAAIAN